MDLRFENANLLMSAALPELAVCYERYERDWDNFGGDPPGPYIVYSGIYQVAIGVLLTLDPVTRGRNERLSAYLSFAEDLLQSDDEKLRFLATDALDGSVLTHPAGPDAVAAFGGQAVRRWFEQQDDAFIRRLRRKAAHDDWECAEFIDLWGVRDTLSVLLPDTETIELPGISHPAQHLRFSTLEEAIGASSGVVFLSAFGTSRPYVVAPAVDVRASEGALMRLARDLADHLGGENPTGLPGAGYFNIPTGERVWQMNVGEREHARYESALWLADDLLSVRDSIQRVLDARESELSLGLG